MIQYIETYQHVVFQYIETYQYIANYLFLQRTLTEKVTFRYYMVYRLVSGFAHMTEVETSIKPKLKLFSLLSILYDLPRVYLNVDMFGSLCSFYYNIIKRDNLITVIRHDGKEFIE